MKRILCSDWLPEWAQWAYLARSGFCRFGPANKKLLKARLHCSLTLQNGTIKNIKHGLLQASEKAKCMKISVLQLIFKITRGNIRRCVEVSW